MIKETSATPNTGFAGNWAWLFPAVYSIHIYEEYWGGFPEWISRFWGVESSGNSFLIWNVTALLLMIAGVLMVIKSKSYRWLLVSFSTVILINGLLHAIASVVTKSYSPGVVSGLLLFIPLGGITLLRGWRRINRRTFNAGLILGVGIHVVVVLLTFGFARISA